MRRLVALLLVLMLAVSFMTVSAAAFMDPAPPPAQGGGSGDGPGTVVGVGQQKEFSAPTVPAEETVPATEFEAPETEIRVPATVETAASETEAMMETDPQTVHETVSATNPQPAVREPLELPKVEGAQELEEAVAMMKVLMIAVVVLVLILVLVLVWGLLLYSKGILVIKKKDTRQHTVTYVTKQEELVRTVRPETQTAPGKVPPVYSHTVKNTETSAVYAPTVKLPEVTKEDDLPPIGQTVLLRKSSEQYTYTDMNRKDRRE